MNKLVVCPKNNFLRPALTVLLAVVCSLFLFVGCQDTSYIDDDYIEVSSLRVSESTVYMSPTGVPSTYQMDVEIVPANATNRRLTYYIPSQYLSYVTVSETGLLSAKADTGDVLVPMTITSTTNKNASIVVNIVVEEVAVKRIDFTEESVSMLYKGESKAISIKYTPAHAVNGRSITYTSLNEEIATVTANRITGETYVTPVGAGQTHIRAVSTTSAGVENEAYIQINVDYAPSQYQLKVSGSPQWSQTLNGSFSTINFTLLVLGENTDPNPSVYWYVGNEKEVRYTDKLQYDHIPTATTPMTYQVRVRVKSYKQDAVWLNSQDIVIYQDFTGFTLEYDNLSNAYDAYQYGDVATFSLKEASNQQTARYNWYLQKMSGDETEFFVGSTSLSDRDLVRRINVTGDYRLTAKAIDGNGNLIEQTPFTFSGERYMVGDTLVVHPQLSDDGIPPDSYNWYIVACDEYGNYDINTKQQITTTAQGETFYYPLREKGYYRLVVTATTNGQPTTVFDNILGKRTVYTHIGEMIRVYSTEDELLTTGEKQTYTLSQLPWSLPKSVYVGNSIALDIKDGENALAKAHWYMIPCDKDGKYALTDKKEITATDGRYVAGIDTEGYFVLMLSTSTKLEGTTEQKNGKEISYIYVSTPVYAETAPKGTAMTELVKIYTITSLPTIPQKVKAEEKFLISNLLNGEGKEYANCAWYTIECDYEGNYTGNKLSEILGVEGNRTYMVGKEGFFRFVVRSTDYIEGAEYAVLDDGIGWYTYYGSLIEIAPSDMVDYFKKESHAFTVSNTTAISDVIIEGARVATENYISVSWTPVGGVSRFIVEITKGEKVILIDSADPGDCVFGSNYIYIPQSIVAFGEAFSLRVKQKDGLFSAVYYYGIANEEGVADETHTLAIDEKYEEYFVDIFEPSNINRYVSSVKELSDLTNYILLYTPTQNKYVSKGNDKIGSGLYDTFSVTFYSSLRLTEDFKTKYNITSTADQEEMYTMMQGVQSASCFLSDYVLTVVRSSTDENIYTATFALLSSRASVASVAGSTSAGSTKSAFYSETPIGNVSTTFVLDNKQKVSCSTSDELVFIASLGHCPVPSNNSVLTTLYRAIKNIYVSICDLGMSDREKALAFFDWMALNISYTPEGKDSIITAQEHYLEGVIAKKEGYSDGIAKTYSILCSLAGIPCKIVKVVENTQEHYLNMIYVDDAWYYVDCSLAGKTLTGVSYADHKYFLQNNVEYMAGKTPIGSYPICEKTYDIDKETIHDNGVVILTALELNELLLSIKSSGNIVVEILCPSNSVFKTLQLLQETAEGFSLGEKEVKKIVKISSEGEIFRTIIMLGDTE